MKPMLCKKAGTDILSSKRYIFQPKLDGTRALYSANQLINRRGKNIISRYPEFSTLEIEENNIIDGEVIIYNDKGIPDFSLLQSREQTSNKFKIELLSKQIPATYVVFDCLEYQGKDITDCNLEERMKFLKKSVKESKHLEIIFSSEDGKKLWMTIKEYGVEGVIAKKKNSKYFPGKRSDKWLKIKNLKTIDCVILGYTKGEGKREETFGALIIGAYNNNKLINLGKVGTGWSDKELIDLKERMDKIIKEKRDNKIFLNPKLVCEVEYLDLTENNDLRAPSFKRLRFDKDPKDCILE
ncbi:MAG: DNA ligase [Candidatus Lokiarchaeota archaeon]|nr:DNA ligase [Candidatus Lokiarchaeota archaeon]MBD3339710.1 DNA ligase [Candidatus Lokiarchaeota archaeon]